MEYSAQGVCLSERLPQKYQWVPVTTADRLLTMSTFSIFFMQMGSILIRVLHLLVLDLWREGSTFYILLEFVAMRRAGFIVLYCPV